MKKYIGLTLLLLAGFVVYMRSQSAITVTPGGTLAACPAPTSGSKALILCNVAGDTSNPDGVYVSANGAAYFRVTTGTTATLPQTIAPVAGTCITGYNAATGIFSTGACLASITKAQVLGTGVAATTTSSTTATTTSTTTLQ